ncbi:MAG TPA: VanZ family protein [Thermoguttaceae bacterium]|nr:VanZ family protein [Thermoguttaceae bacterium]
MKNAYSKLTCLSVLFTVAMVALLLMPMPDGGRRWTALCDFAHAPVFAIFSGLLMGGLVRWRKRNTAALAMMLWLGVTGFGLLTEVLQGLVGRHPSWHDVRADALGAAVGICWVIGRSADATRRRVAFSIAGGCLLLFAAVTPLLTLTDVHRQETQMPMLSSFERSLEMSRWSKADARIRPMPMHATDGLWSLRVALRPAIYPGATMEYPYPDWSVYEALEMDIFLEGADPLDLTVKIEDALHNDEPYDRFEQRVRLLPGMQRVRIALRDVAAAPRDRKMDLRRISRLQFFAIRLNSPRTFFLDNVHLH